MITATLMQYGGFIGFIAAIIGGLAAAYFGGKVKGSSKSEVEAAQQREAFNNHLAAETVIKERIANEAAINTVQGASDAQTEVLRNSDSANADELRRDWTRD